MRYLPHTDAERQEMLAAIGVANIDDLFIDVPPVYLNRAIEGLPGHASELAVEQMLTRLAAKNVPAASVPFFAGCGAYKHHIPASVDHLIQRSEFLTAYTPYQPEIAQGTLQYIFEFQSQVALLTGMDVANASMYDGSTAAAEAVLMAHRVTKRKRAVLSGGLNPHYRAVVETLGAYGGSEVTTLPPLVEDDFTAAIDTDTSCVVVQYPGVFGDIRDLTPVADAVHKVGALLIVVVTEAVSFGALKSPGAMGADIVVAEGQSIGNGLNFGGPYVGLFATRDKFVRQMPGRLCGETVDADGRRGFVLTLATREQHIRREKATSNICTNSGLCALAFTIHLTLLGEAGLRKLAHINHANAVMLAELLAKIPSVEIVTPRFFNEFTIRTPKSGATIIDALVDEGVIGGVPASRLFPSEPALDNLIIVAATEMNSDTDRQTYAAALAKVIA